MIEAHPDRPDLCHLLSGIGVEKFFADYWQKQTVSLSLKADDFAHILAKVGPLNVARFTGLAREGAQAWIANEYVAHSVIPVNADNAAKFFEMGATLYFLNVSLPGITNSVADFLGAPRQKIIASVFLTPAGGGASPHFDKNENFTIQLTGAKRWIVGDTPLVAAAPDGHILGQSIPSSLLNLMPESNGEPDRVVEMRPGMLLYLPRGTVHCTTAGETSWSLNLSYSPAMWLDLFRVGLRRRLLSSPRWRGTVTGVGAERDPAAEGANILPELAQELREMLADTNELQLIVREFLSNPDA